MLLIQIIDENGTRSVELPDQPFLVGSHPECDVVLDFQGISAEHLAIKPAGKDAWRMRVLRGKGVLLNGQPVRDGRLGAGDRIKLGPVTIEISRAAHQRETVFEEAPARRKRQPQAAGSNRKLYVVGALALLAFISYKLFFNSDQARQEGVTQVETFLGNDQLEEAALLLDKLDEEIWQSPAFVPKLEKLKAELDSKITAAANQLLEPIWEKAVSGTGVTSEIQHRLIPDLHRQGKKYLAHFLYKRLSGIPEEFLERKGDYSAARAAKHAAGQAARIPVMEVIDRVDSFMDAGRILEAIQLIDQARVEAGSPAAANDYLIRRRVILGNLARKTNNAYYRAIDLANTGKPRRALTLLAQVKGYLPPIGELKAKVEWLSSLEREIRPLVGLAVLGKDEGPRKSTVKPPSGTSPGQPPKSGKAGEKKPRTPEVIDWDKIAKERERTTRRPGPGASSRRIVSSLLEEAERQQENWAFVEAARLFMQISNFYPAAKDKAAIARCKAEFIKALVEVVTKQPGECKGITLADGGKADLLRADTLGVTVRVDGDEASYPWRTVGSKGALALGARVSLKGRPRLGMAALALDSGQADRCDKLLNSALKKDRELMAVALPILRHRTGKLGPFSWFREKWLPTAEMEDILRYETLAKELKKIFSCRELAKREKDLAALVASGEGARGAVARGMEARLKVLVEETAKMPFFRKLEKMSAIRQELDKARKHALDLIFDEVKYFYPFRPPECPAHKAKEYHPVQMEVNKRLRAVELIWEKKTQIRIPSSLRQLAEEAIWVHRQLAVLGSSDYGTEDMLVDIYRLPLDEDSVTVRNFAFSISEQKQLRYSRRVRRYNLVAEIEPTGTEMEQMRITNDYRMMMGRRSLAINAKLIISARGHSEEMSTIGYFSHFSPNKERRTPYQRMQLAGYGMGVSENIARIPGPMAAHKRWLQSSGHHRNILKEGHREFATGNAGAFWTQNFGRGQEFEKDPLFEPE